MLTGLELCNQILTQEYRSNDTDYRDFDQFVEMASDLMVIEVGPIPDQVKLRIFGSTVLTDWHSKCTTRCDQSLVLQDE